MTTSAVAKGFAVTILTHTDDARQVLSHPEEVRFKVGSSLDAAGLQEEVDYTLEVGRMYSNAPIEPVAQPAVPAEDAVPQAVVLAIRETRRNADNYISNESGLKEEYHALAYGAYMRALDHVAERVLAAYRGEKP